MVYYVNNFTKVAMIRSEANVVKKNDMLKIKHARHALHA